MNKYLVALLVFNLSLILFGFNAVASAYVSGCTSAGPYNTITGKLCDANEVVTCPTGDLFSSVTGQACTVWQASSVSFSDLRIGSRGESVRTFQQTLAGAGFSPGVIDGIYGPMTSVAAISYYKKYPISSIFPEPVPKALTITTTSPLPNARVGVQYKAYLYASSGFSLYYWSTVFGTALPPGLAFTASEDCGTTSTLPNVSNCILILGTPTTSGNYFPNISVSAGSQSATKQFSLTVDPATTTTAPTIVSISILPEGCSSNMGYSPVTGESCANPRLFANFGDTVNIYGSNFTSNNFAFTYSTLSGDYVTMPTKFISSSLLSFVVPSNAGTGQHGIALKKNNDDSFVSNYVSLNFTNITTSTLTITTTSPLPNAKVGTNYTTDLRALCESITCFAAVRQWSVTSGFLPNGLHLSAIDATDTILTGTPTLAGNYNFTLTVTLTNTTGSQSATKQFTLTVDPATIACTVGFDTTTSFRCGCTSTSGYSKITGESCAISYDKYGKVLGAESFNFTQPLQNGSSGNEVMELQKFLNGAGYDAGTVDGKFGSKTEVALTKFQVANGLVGDGVVGPLVRALLNSY